MVFGAKARRNWTSDGAHSAMSRANDGELLSGGTVLFRFRFTSLYRDSKTLRLKVDQSVIACRLRHRFPHLFTWLCILAMHLITLFLHCRNRIAIRRSSSVRGIALGLTTWRSKLLAGALAELIPVLTAGYARHRHWHHCLRVGTIISSVDVWEWRKKPSYWELVADDRAN